MSHLKQSYTQMIANKPNADQNTILPLTMRSFPSSSSTLCSRLNNVRRTRKMNLMIGRIPYVLLLVAVAVVGSFRSAEVQVFSVATSTAKIIPPTRTRSNEENVKYYTADVSLPTTSTTTTTTTTAVTTSNTQRRSGLMKRGAYGDGPNYSKGSAQRHLMRFNNDYDDNDTMERLLNDKKKKDWKKKRLDEINKKKDDKKDKDKKKKKEEQDVEDDDDYSNNDDYKSKNKKVVDGTNQDVQNVIETITDFGEDKAPTRAPIFENLGMIVSTRSVRLKPFMIQLDQRVQESQLREALTDYLTTTMMLDQEEGDKNDSITLFGTPHNTMGRSFNYTGSLLLSVQSDTNGLVSVLRKSDNLSNAGNGTSNTGDDDSLWLLKQTMALVDSLSLMDALNRYNWTTTTTITSPSTTGKLHTVSVAFTDDIDDTSEQESGKDPGIRTNLTTSQTADYEQSQVGNPVVTHGNTASTGSSTSDQTKTSTSLLQNETFLWILIGGIICMVSVLSVGFGTYYYNDRILTNRKNRQYLDLFDNLSQDDIDGDSNSQNKIPENYTTTENEASDTGTSSLPAIFRLPDDDDNDKEEQPTYSTNMAQLLCYRKSAAGGATATGNDDYEDGDDIITYQTPSVYCVTLQKLQCLSPLTRTSSTSTKSKRRPGNASSLSVVDPAVMISDVVASRVQDNYHRNQWENSSVISGGSDIISTCTSNFCSSFRHDENTNNEKTSNVLYTTFTTTPSGFNATNKDGSSTNNSNMTTSDPSNVTPSETIFPELASQTTASTPSMTRMTTATTATTSTSMVVSPNDESTTMMITASTMSAPSAQSPSTISSSSTDVPASPAVIFDDDNGSTISSIHNMVI